MIRAPALLCSLTLMSLLTLEKPAWPQDVSESSLLISIMLRPAAEPIPALKYRLLPERHSLVPGNAAVFYHRAIEMLLDKAAAQRQQLDPEKSIATEEQASGPWINGPLEAIPLDQAREWLDVYQNALVEVSLGARRQICNWEFDLRSEGTELLLPEIQHMRSLIRLAALKVRIAIRAGKIDEAIDWLQTGYAMARHVSEGPILLQGLVGISMSAVMTTPLEDLIQAPGVPSLFWALANRPRPFVDLAEAIDGERFLLERELPSLRELDGPPWSVEKARAFGEELRTKLFRLSGYAARSSTGSNAAPFHEWTSKLGLAALVAQAYPEAKLALSAQGTPAAQVEAMPALQVTALHTMRSYQELRDNVFKWTCIPYHQAHRHLDESSLIHKVGGQPNPLLRMFTLLIPAVSSVQMAQLRVDRRLDVMQCIEGIRIYCAAHGKFPSALNDITEAPVPLDVATGQPFEFRVDGDHAILSAPSPRGTDIPQYRITYDLKWAR
jgi:hypothetical protein